MVFVWVNFEYVRVKIDDIWDSIILIQFNYEKKLHFNPNFNLINFRVFFRAGSNDYNYL